MFFERIPWGKVGSTVLSLCIGGGLVVAVFNWYVNRPVSTIVESVIRNTRLETGADSRDWFRI